MALIKKNIWSLYYLILIVGIIILGFVLFNIKNNIYNLHKKEQEHFVKVNATAVSSTLLQYELILDILGSQLVEKQRYKSFKQSREILDSIIKINPHILAFGLAKPDGQLYVTSSNLKHINKLPNLLDKKETKDSFLNALNKNTMVLGRTYFHKTIKTLIIPIRKTIKDNEGKIIAVMTAGIKLDKAFNLPRSTKLFRHTDFYYQLTEQRSGDNLKVYNTPVPKKGMQKIYFDIEQAYNEDIENIKKEEKVVTVEYVKYVDKMNTLATSKYINRYDLWVVEQKSIDNIFSEIFTRSTAYSLIFVFIYLILFYLFRSINNIEKEKNKALYKQATQDHLTKLNNRFYLMKKFGALDKQTSKAFSLFFIDMDNFKNVNDNYGHDYGDLVLKEISKRLTNLKKEEDALIRYSGDEFIFITYENDNKKIEEIANKVLFELSKPYQAQQYQFILGSSIGIAKFPQDGKNIDEVGRYADIAMYEAKKKKNTYVMFENTLKNKYLRAAQIENELKSAVEKNEIYMAYQPQICNSGKLFGVEALVRWENEKLGFVPPDEFIKVAEDSGLMVKLGEFISNQSFKEIKQIQDELNFDFQLSINISVKQFMEPKFYDKIFEQIENINFKHLQVTLEVTENVFIEDINFILELLNKLKKQNIKISLDDFGTGYSSLSLLKKLPIDELKIDKSFVDDILVDKDSENMIETIISIGKRFGLLIVAEGIEQKEQKEKLDSLSCDLYQGYYFSKPLRKDDLKKYLKDNFA